MRYKLLILALMMVIAGGAGPFSGRYARMNQLYPGVTGPGPGVIGVGGMGGSDSSSGQAKYGYGDGMFGQQTNAQVTFKGPEDKGSGMTVLWDIAQYGLFDSEPLQCPGSQNFEMGKAYRLKLTFPSTEKADQILYPTLEINQMTVRTRSYLEHNAIPVSVTANDLDQVKNDHFVTKVIYLPSPEFQNLAIAGGVDTIVNTQLPAGSDPVIEAQHRGAVLAVLRIGNRNLNLPGSEGANELSIGEQNGRVPQIPISGVNVPAFGTPNTLTPYGVTGPAVLPPPGRGRVAPRLMEPMSPMPSTDAPVVSPKWSGNNF